MMMPTTIELRSGIGMHAKNPDAQALVPAKGREFVGIGAVCGENASLLFAIYSRVPWNANFVVQEGLLTLLGMNVSEIPC